MPYEKKDSTWISITVEMDLTRLRYERSRYTFFDLLSDVGGLSGMFASIFTIFMSKMNLNDLDNYLVSKLYKVTSYSTKLKSSLPPTHFESKKTCCPLLKDYMARVRHCTNKPQRKE